MAKDLSNYFDDWTKVYRQPRISTVCFKAMDNWCIGRFGVKGLIWDYCTEIEPSDPSLSEEFTQKRRVRHYFRFKNSDDAMLFRLKFAEYLC